MAAADKNVSPEERLLNVIRGKEGQDSGKASKDAKGGQAASASVDEQAPPLDEAPPPASPPPSPAPTVRIPNPATAAAAASSATTAPEPQTTATRPKGALGDEKLKAALSRKVSERTKGDDKSGSATVPKGLGGAAGAIARAAAQEASSTASARPSSVSMSAEATRQIAKKIQGDTAPGVRYVSVSFAALILIVLMFSAYEIVAAIRMDPIPKPPSDEASPAHVEDLLRFSPLYQLEKVKHAFTLTPLFGRPPDLDPTNPNPTSRPPWIDELQKNYTVLGRLGDPNTGGELILSDKRDSKQYFTGMKSGIDVAGVTIYLKSCEGNRAVFHDSETQYTAELSW